MCDVRARTEMLIFIAICEMSGIRTRRQRGVIEPIRNEIKESAFANKVPLHFYSIYLYNLRSIT